MIADMRFLVLGLGLVMASSLRAEPLDCVINPAIVVGVGGPVPGLLEEVLIDRGDQVSAGQVLARLSADTEHATVALMSEQASSTAEIEAQEARYKLAFNRMKRTETLVAQNFSSQDALEEAVAQMEVAEREVALARTRKRILELELERARKALEQKVIASPIDGVVVERLLDAVEYLDQDGKLATIAKLDPLHVEVFVPVSEFGKFQLGMAAKVLTSNPPGGDFLGTVQVLDRVFDPASRTFGVRIELPNPENFLPAGQRCQVVFEDIPD